jgi:hypothetical protein
LTFLAIAREAREGAAYASGTALDYGLDDRWFKSRHKLGIFLFTTM